MKPCPFCGNRYPVVSNCSTAKAFLACVSCNECGARGPSVSADSDTGYLDAITAAHAAYAWDTRLAEAEQRVRSVR